MSYSLLETLLVLAIVLLAASFAAWRLAGPFGRLRILRGGARVFAALGARGLAARTEAALARRQAQQSGSPCANCGPAADKTPPLTPRS